MRCVYWTLLLQIDMVTEREDRWSHDMKADIPRRKGILKQIHKFDNNFFGIHSKQTKVMDPQGRLLIECAYEAVVDSGINPQTLRGQNIGVFVANSFSESEKAFMHDTVGGETFNLTGYDRFDGAPHLRLILTKHKFLSGHRFKELSRHDGKPYIIHFRSYRAVV